MKFNLDQFVRTVVGLKSASYNTGTTNGTGIDRAGYEEALVIVNSGINGTGGTVAIKVQESDDNSTFADITGAAFATITEATDDTVYVGRLNLQSRKRYLRVVATVATAACHFGVNVLLSGAKSLPVQQVNAVSFSV